ncbi:hypothetical protein JQ604_11490 [Bradyrhizobium jicamae]|uniref:hypothetical protein n=1 Tax=Bradyrhizobium jicamae TaxID=280332 RepID=UPI001BA77532|nr:hypothetical protein [Bradyrhizobium jicamae]MBR0752808.1 hypothetical protein [Bradyrhizobium jicamae]
MKHEPISDETTPLPSTPDGWFDYAYAVLWNGDLAVVRTDGDVHAEVASWYDQIQRGNTHAPHPGFQGRHLRLSTFDGNTESGAIEIPACPWPRVDRLPDGRWLVAKRRAEPDASNACLFAADGTPAGTFAMGDGIAHIQCAEDGTIWVGYFDEGVFSGASEGGSWPVSSSGIARFGSDGSVLWKFNDHARDNLFIADCYALTIDGSPLWCCAYEGFPIVKVERGVIRHWRNEVAGAKALAVDGDLVLLAGGYGDQSERIALLHLGDDHQAQQIGESQFQRPDRNKARLVQGRGATLHIVGQGNWTRLSVAAINANRIRGR